MKLHTSHLTCYQLVKKISFFDKFNSIILFIFQQLILFSCFGLGTHIIIYLLPIFLPFVKVKVKYKPLFSDILDLSDTFYHIWSLSGLHMQHVYMLICFLRKIKSNSSVAQQASKTWQTLTHADLSALKGKLSPSCVLL